MRCAVAGDPSLTPPPIPTPPNPHPLRPTSHPSRLRRLSTPSCPLLPVSVSLFVCSVSLFVMEMAGASEALQPVWQLSAALYLSLGKGRTHSQALQTLPWHAKITHALSGWATPGRYRRQLSHLFAERMRPGLLMSVWLVLRTGGQSRLRPVPATLPG